MIADTEQTHTEQTHTEQINTEQINTEQINAQSVNTESIQTKMNVLHAPVNVGSQAALLAKAENESRSARQQPGRSWSVDFEPHACVSMSDETFAAPAGMAGKIYRSVAPFLYGLWHIGGFHVLHLYFGKSLLRFERGPALLGHVDLPLWKALGKTVFVTFQGCDARLRGRAAERPFSPCREGVCDVPCCDAQLDMKRNRWNRQMARWADKVFCLNPDLLGFVPRAEFLPYANIATDLRPAPGKDAGRPPRIVHAPTNRAIKGTAELLRVSESLQASHPHHLQLVEGALRHQALRIYAEADVVVDQLRIGWYGGLAVEAMAMGVPVVAYLDQDDLARIPPPMRAELPIVSASPESLPEVLARLLENPEVRMELGRRGPAFVRRWHNPLKIASRMLDLYHDPQQSFWEGYHPEQQRRSAA